MAEKIYQETFFLARFTFHGTAGAICCNLLPSAESLFSSRLLQCLGLVQSSLLVMRWLHRLAAIPSILVPLYCLFFSLKGAKAFVLPEHFWKVG